MPRHPRPRTRPLTVLAQDPSILRKGQVLTTRLPVPFEATEPGPRGSRIHVVDFDTTSGKLYAPLVLPRFADPYEGVGDPDLLLGDPRFHQQNVYAIAMSTLARFEQALGRRVAWGFDSHVLRIAPHAFAEPNAFYAPSVGALLFGSFRTQGETVHTCLSHDIVVHETTHALLDGLRKGFGTFVSPDQAAFHEGFSDVVALLSVFAQTAVVDRALDDVVGKERWLEPEAVRRDALSRSFLLKLGEQMGKALEGGLADAPGNALRESVGLDPSDVDWDSSEFHAPHRRGEVLVAAVLNAFLDLWMKRLEPSLGGRAVDRDRVVEEGSKAADRLLNILVRSLDYTPPIDLSFSDYLSAVLTADAELWPDDTTYQMRDTLRNAFATYKIQPQTTQQPEPGTWDPPSEPLSYNAVHAGPLREDATEVMRFLWDNWRVLRQEPNADTRVLSVRPCVRVGVDGFVLRETVAEVIEVLQVTVRELRALGMELPTDVPPALEMTLHGGRTLIFDEFGALKYDVGTGVLGRRQKDRIARLWETGQVSALQQGSPFGRIHPQRQLGAANSSAERW